MVPGHTLEELAQVFFVVEELGGVSGWLRPKRPPCDFELHYFWSLCELGLDQFQNVRIYCLSRT